MRTQSRHILPGKNSISSESIEGIETPVGIETKYLGRYADDDDDKRPPWDHFAWSVTLAYKGRTLTTPYRMGIGHVTKTERRAWNPTIGEYDAAYEPSPPDAKTVIGSLLSDASALDEAFDDWAANCGYDADSRKALDIYLRCQTAGREVQRLLGADIEAFRVALEDY